MSTSEITTVGASREAQVHESEIWSLGMWVFLASEIIFFGSVFFMYTAYRYYYPSDFAAGSRHMNVISGTINTAVLLFSSFCMARAVQAAKQGLRRRLIALVLATFILGLAFLGIKAAEYYQHWVEGSTPWAPVDGGESGHIRLYYSLYYFATGLHGLHVIGGLIVIGATAFCAWRRINFLWSRDPVEVLGLYWHFVDIVWIFLFPLFYLTGNA